MVGLDDSYFEIILQKNIELWKSAAKEEKIKLFENELITWSFSVLFVWCVISVIIVWLILIVAS